MKKLLFLFTALLFNSCSGDDDSSTTTESTNPVYLSENGVTVKARDWASVGMSGKINGITYTIVDKDALELMINNDEDVTVVCTSRILDMEYIFNGNRNFNQNIISWDVSNVTTMSGMFVASEFNQDIGLWDVSNVTDMSFLFLNEGNVAAKFNQDISNWDVSGVTNMDQVL